MNHATPGPSPITPHDYGRALQSAVSWLGDRYLLAEPQPRRTNDRPKYWTAAKHAERARARPARRTA